MNQGRSAFWCTGVAYLFECNVLQPTCQNCWFTFPFAEEDRFWNGCHTSTKGLLFKHRALLHSYLSSRRSRLHEAWGFFETPVSKERKCCLPLVWIQMEYGIQYFLRQIEVNCISITRTCRYQPRCRKNFLSFTKHDYTKNVYGQTWDSSTWSHVVIYQTILRAYFTS